MKDTTTPTKSKVKYQKPTKRSRKYLVSEYLPLPNTSNRLTFASSTPSAKRCTYYREIEISYDVDSAVMTVTSL